IGQPLVKTSSTINLSWGVASTSTKVEQAVKFIELLTTDAEFANLCSYGIEGTHYVLKDGSSKIIDYPEGKDAMTVGYGSFIGPWGDSAQIYQKAPLDESFYDALDALGPKGRMSKFMGYTFDTSSVTAELTAVQAVVTKYGPSLSCGVVDADTVIDQFRQELKDAGIDKVIAENQKQLDAWLASK
ncbi:MAG: DUF3502 domain-containing protein, partial [Bacteroidaceae bacterium]|nr:DUF3502 domain-containing protein [Bacteroidaceae bacterium]